MKPGIARTVALPSFVLAVGLSPAWPEQAQDAKAPYPSMAPLEQYLTADRNAEIALARSAAPESISRDAEVMVLERQGYGTAVKGKNGFVCMVQRSWFAPIDDPEFWNPKLRAPICFNPPAARSYLSLMIKRTELVLAGQTQAQEQYLSDRGGHWHPHLMFFLPQTAALTWGADLPGSPILATQDPLDRLTVFLIPVAKWSDGTAESTEPK
jgi:hypothetical protein